MTCAVALSGAPAAGRGPLSAVARSKLVLQLSASRGDLNITEGHFTIVKNMDTHIKLGRYAPYLGSTCAARYKERAKLYLIY